MTKASSKLTVMNALNLVPHYLELADLRPLWSKPAALTVDVAAKPSVDAAAQAAALDNARIFVSMTMRRTRRALRAPDSNQDARLKVLAERVSIVGRRRSTRPAPPRCSDALRAARFESRRSSSWRLRCSHA
jgi:hypothetical protein